MRSVKEGAPSFLQYLSKIGIYIGAKVMIIEKIAFDSSLEVQIDNKSRAFISREVAENLLILQ